MGFIIYENKLCNKGNKTIWEAHREFAFIVEILRTLVFSREAKNIDLHLAGVSFVLTTQPKSTLVPMILLDVF